MKQQQNDSQRICSTSISVQAVCLVSIVATASGADPEIHPRDTHPEIHPRMMLLLLPKWDRPCAKRVAQTCADMLPSYLYKWTVAICEDCRQNRDHELTEANYFNDLCGYNQEGVMARRVSLVQPIRDSLGILQTCDVFYMCGGSPGQVMPTDLVEAISAWKAFRWSWKRLHPAWHARVHRENVRSLRPCAVQPSFVHGQLHGRYDGWCGVFL